VVAASNHPLRDKIKKERRGRNMPPSEKDRFSFVKMERSGAPAILGGMRFCASPFSWAKAEESYGRAGAHPSELICFNRDPSVIAGSF
jgi:hypothetical protein